MSFFGRKFGRKSSGDLSLSGDSRSSTTSEVETIAMVNLVSGASMVNPSSRRPASMVNLPSSVSMDSLTFPSNTSVDSLPDVFEHLVGGVITEGGGSADIAENTGLVGENTGTVGGNTGIRENTETVGENRDIGGENRNLGGNDTEIGGENKDTLGEQIHVGGDGVGGNPSRSGSSSSSSSESDAPSPSQSTPSPSGGKGRVKLRHPRHLWRAAANRTAAGRASAAEIRPGGGGALEAIQDPRRFSMGYFTFPPKRQAWLRSPSWFSLSGHEQPYSIKMSHVRDATRGPDDGPIDVDANDNSIQCQFVLRPAKKDHKGPLGEYLHYLLISFFFSHSSLVSLID